MVDKAELLGAIAGWNRGLLATEAEKQTILDAIAQVELQNPTPCPFKAPELLAGNWRLLFTTSQELLQIDRFPFLKLKQIYQYVQVEPARIYNVAEVGSFPLDGLVSVTANFETTSETRVSVQFERAIFGVQRWVGYQAVEPFIQDIESGRRFFAVDFKITPSDRRGWLDITYLDHDLRIGRGNQGNVFVLAKVPASPPTTA